MDNMAELETPGISLSLSTLDIFYSDIKKQTTSESANERILGADGTKNEFTTTTKTDENEVIDENMALKRRLDPMYFATNQKNKNLATNFSV